MQLLSKPDLYVEVSAGDSFARTATQPNTSSPSFTEPLLLFPKHPQSAALPTSTPPLIVRVFDDDSLGIDNRFVRFVEVARERLGRANAFDDALGSATVPLDDCWETMLPQEATVRSSSCACCACSGYRWLPRQNEVLALTVPFALRCPRVCMHACMHVCMSAVVRPVEWVCRSRCERQPGR